MDSDTLKLAQTIFVENCITISLTGASNIFHREDMPSTTLLALPLNEYLVTIDQEVELVWRRKARFSLPSILLVSTRVCMVAEAILAVIAPSTCKGIKIFGSLLQILNCAGFIQVALFSALRVSALYNWNVALFVVVFVLGLVPVGTNIFKQARTTYIEESGTCFSINEISDALTRKLVLVTRIPVIVADFLVLILTWAKTYEQILLSRGSGISTPLSTCLARDGALYFLMLLVVNILEIATYRTNLGTPVSSIVTVLPPILINRFMLNLRQVGTGPNPSASINLNSLVVSTPRFQLSNQVVGSMGEPLEHGGSAIPGEEEGEADGENVEVDGLGGSSQREESREAEGQSEEASGSGAPAV